jgi:eukaryotic-like serine/threonine-protein kinase
MYFFRALSILSAISALIAAAFWVGDKITHTSFTQGWILFSSVLWMVLFWAIYRALDEMERRHETTSEWSLWAVAVSCAIHTWEEYMTGWQEWARQTLGIVMPTSTMAQHRNDTIVERAMPLAPGTRLGPYEIVSRIGAGGMGEVWKARDTRLDRVVAVKVKSGRFSERFEREARAIAALNHPNVAQIYDVGENYIVMEYIDGQPVRPTDEVRKVLDAAVQIADGLAAAHAAGFIHRDLKPGNILRTREGRVKILDFGLVKRAATGAESDETRTMLSDPGTVVGTPSYMSPEQARGQEVDFRTDQFSLGLVVYEMLTGRRAFQRPTTVETMTAIIRDDVEPIPPTAPPALRWTVERCLAKDPEQRYDSTRDLYRELRKIREHFAEGHTGIDGIAQPRGRGGRTLIMAAAALILLVGGTAMARWLADRGAGVAEWTGSQLGGPGIAIRPTISPDGQLLAFSAMVDGQTQLAVMKPDSGSWSVLTHERNAGMQAQMSWAPDGSRIYFDRVWGGPRGVYSISPLGGEPRLLQDAAQCPRALPDGSLIITQIDRSARFRLFRLWPDSGKLDPLPALVGGGLSTVIDPLVQVFPDGREAVYLGTPDSKPDGLPRWYVIDLASLRSRPLNSQVVGNAFAVGVTPDDRSALIVNSMTDQWEIAAVPRSGAGAIRALISFPKPHNIYGIDAARDGSVYFDYMMRQTAVLQFDTAAKAVTETVTTIDRTMIPLGADSFLVDRLENGKRRLKVFRAGVGSQNLLQSSEESSSPAARVGDASVAFLAGPEDSARIALATVREGRIVKRFPFDASSVTSIAATPDGNRLYYCDGRQVWSIGTSADEGAKPVRVTEGGSVAIDPAGKYLYVKGTRTEHQALVRMPLAGGKAETLAIPPQYTVSDHALSPAAADASGRITFEVDSADTWYERVAVIDTLRKTFTVYHWHSRAMFGTPDGKATGESSP